MHRIHLDPLENQIYTHINRRPRRSGLIRPIDGVFFSLLLTGFLLTSCRAPSALTPSPRSTGLPIPTHSPVLAYQRTPTSQPGGYPTATPLACLKAGGTVETLEVRDNALVAPLRIRIYLPPCYEQDTYATYPVLILLHGLLATDIQWDELGMDELADQWIQSGSSPPFIMIMPWIRNSEDSYSAVVDHLIPFALEKWRISENRELWAIGGISRGAGQALQIGLLNPERFGAIGLHSPATLHQPELILSWIEAIEPDMRPAIWFDIGEADSLLETANLLLDQLLQTSVNLTYSINPGDHTTAYWQANLVSYLGWYRTNWLKSTGP